MSDFQARLPIPADGEVFELAIDGDVPENQPLGMVRYGYGTGKWQHVGQTIGGRQTRRFMWVAVGCQPNLDAVRAECVKSGKVPEGQWCEALKQAGVYLSDGRNARGIADPSWIGPDGRACFLAVDTDGILDLHFADGVFDDDWRWLVEVE